MDVFVSRTVLWVVFIYISRDDYLGWKGGVVVSDTPRVNGFVM